MSVQSQMQQDMIAALKARDQEKRSALSFLVSEVKRVAIDKRVEELPDAEAISVLQKQLKLRQEALQQAKSAGRDDLARARLRPDAHAAVLEPVTGQESHMIVRAAGADALVFVPRGDGELPAGADVRYLRL